MVDSQLSRADTMEQITQCYHKYRHTEDMDRKGLFFSPNCLQICRPIPSCAARNRDQIVQYLRDAQLGIIPVETSSSCDDTSNVPKHDDSMLRSAKPRSVYTIRPLHACELEFGTDDITGAVGFTVEELKQKAVEEKWVGMRVDLWNEDGNKKGLLVKVQYWWRLEDISSDEQFMDKLESMGWRQCLHDIMYLGPKDGTEGDEGAEVLELAR